MNVAARSVPLLAVAVAVAASGCSRGEVGDLTPTEAGNEILARTFMVSWESGDTTTLATLFYPDAVYDDYAGQAQHQGIGEILQYLTTIQTWATNLSIDVGAVHPSNHGATIEWILSATQDRPLGSLVPEATNRDVVLNGVTILEIDHDRIRRAADYIDELPLLLQLGAQVELPGGSTLRLNDVLPPGAAPADTGGVPPGGEGPPGGTP